MELDRHISVIEADGITGRLLAAPPVFIRHIFPINGEGVIRNDKADDCGSILDCAKTICDINDGDGFSVQCRILRSEAEYTSKDIEVYVGTYFDKMGGVPLFSDREIMNSNVKVVSVLIFGRRFYVGFSAASENLNPHSDEYRILSRSGREISRAENKLKEAISKFNITVTGSGLALDIGASPGGWTKVLADYGFTVYAVDPGLLKECLYGHPNIIHIKDKIENVDFNERFEIIVNDMNVDPNITAEMMCRLAPRLVKGGLAVVTLKLPFADAERSINEASEILRQAYEIIAVRNLTHNRSEVTALLIVN